MCRRWPFGNVKVYLQLFPFKITTLYQHLVDTGTRQSIQYTLCSNYADPTNVV